MHAEGDIPLSKLERLISYLIDEFGRYPYDDHKDRGYFSRLIPEFSDLDIEEELKQYHAWVLDQPDTKKIYYRSRFRTWLKTARRFGQDTEQQRPFWLRRRDARTRY